jgi:Zinc carboxypeptidase
MSRSRPGWRVCLLVAGLAGCAAMPAPSQTAAAPGAEAPYGAAVAARFPEPAVRYDTPGLAADREHYTSNDELQAWLQAIVRGGTREGTRAELIEAGRSQQGEPLQALRLSRGADRPVVLLIGQQHGDEPAGAEALLAMARELAHGHLVADVLDRLDVVLLPRANPDGAASASRVAADGLDINRDHLLLRTPEAQAQARLVRELTPLVVVDLHEHTVVGRYLEKFNAIQRHDLLLQHAMTANYPPELAQASERWFLEPIRHALTQQGLTHEWYYTNPTAPGDLRLSMGGVQPDTGRNVHGLKHAVSLLLESRGVGIGRLHLQRRVHSHVVAVRAVLASAAGHATALQALQRRVGDEVAAAACKGDVAVLARTTTTQRPLAMLDPEHGRDKMVVVHWDSALQPRVLRERARPCGYWIGHDGEAAAQRLRALGLRVVRFADDTPLQAEAWQERSRIEGERPDVRGSVADAARTVIGVRVTLAGRDTWAPKNSWYVPLDQPLAHLAVAALEPDTPSSYFANRVLPSLDSALRVRVPPDAARLLK